MLRISLEIDPTHPREMYVQQLLEAGQRLDAASVWLVVEQVVGGVWSRVESETQKVR